ncbi:polynucleotide adenylyltransferase [Caenorhabditis elegans]|nr:PAP-associated domain-containing protein [Caenorhabditis elegans]CTQ86416.1 PAP-associated domain-containing protein [Caenorhabditis elegans]|eukprot:NP_001300477.1 Poly(A) RNA polymerase gld-2 [Caenorhabditis elegans]
MPASIELQHKTANQTMPVDIVQTNQQKTVSSYERAAQFRASASELPTDSVDAKHPCFANERMQSALIGISPQLKTQQQSPGIPIQNEAEASAVMKAMRSFQFHNWPQMSHGSYYPMPYHLENQMRPMKSGDQLPLNQQNHNLSGFPAFVGKSSLVGSSLNTRNSSEADPEEMPRIMEKLDDEVTGADHDKTIDENRRRIHKSQEPRIGTEEKALNELPRKANRRNSSCSSISSVSESSSPSALDESTLTKILPTDNFRGGRGFASPSPPTSLLSEPLSRMDVLSEKIWDYHNKVSQTDEMLQRKLHLRDMLYTAISPVFPLSGLYVVGSSLNGFGNNSSDMDLCLMITNKDLDQKNDAVVVLNLILSTLQYEKFVESQKLILAKVPILRINFAAPFDDITVDLNANNSVAIRNTHLLCYYSSYDWRVRPLVSVVKEWAKRKGINDANKSSFTSYSLVLMVIHFLQCGPTKVLPNLQQSYPNRFSNKVDVRTLNVTMALEEVADDIDQSLSEKTTLGELLIGFLDYYANEFNYDRDAISIRQGRRVERAALAVRPKIHSNSEGDKETPPPSSSASTSSIHNGGTPGIPMHHSISNPHFWRSQWRCVCIEEPFTNSNTAHSIYDEMVFEAIKKAFREAHGELQHNHDLDKLMECEPIKASTTNTGAAVFAATYEGERPLAQQPNTIACASLRVLNSIPVSSGPGHYHYQQQSNQNLSRPQRPGSNQGYQMNNNRGFNGNNQQQHQNRRSFNNQSSSNPGNGSTGPRSSRSNENVRDSSRQQNSQKGSSGVSVSKENVASTTGVPVDKKQQNSNRKDDGNRTKRSPMVQSPEPAKTKSEKTPMASSNVSQ